MVTMTVEMALMNQKMYAASQIVHVLEICSPVTMADVLIHYFCVMVTMIVEMAQMKAVVSVQSDKMSFGLNNAFQV